MGDLGSNPGRRGGKLEANRLSYGTATRKLIATPSVTVINYSSVDQYFPHVFNPNNETSGPHEVLTAPGEV
jgi:hypothetical protein